MLIKSISSYTNPVPSRNSIRPGSTIRNNSATVVASKAHNNYDHHSVVLCIWRNELVTWVYNHMSDACSGGHYHQTDIEAAVKDFTER